MTDPAVFLDRDGTLIEDAGYIGDPDQVRLLPNVPEGLALLKNAGYRLVLVSNQSGIARGLFDEAALSCVHERMAAELSALGIKLDGVYYCPYLQGPEAVVSKYRRDSPLRKPRPGMLAQAAGDMGLDLKRSWMVGNSDADVQAGRAAGCRTVRIVDHATKAGAQLGAAGEPGALMAADLREAAEIILSAGESTMDPSPHAQQDAHREARPAAQGTREEVELLRRIHDQLDKAHRQSRQHDFSVLRLFGALLQMLAIVAGLWGLMALTGDRNDAAIARLALAGLLQLASIAAFVHDHFR